MTTAERIAAQLSAAGGTWAKRSRKRMARKFLELCSGQPGVRLDATNRASRCISHEPGVPCENPGYAVRWVFADGSVITLRESGWDFGCPDCWGWPEVIGHDDGCPRERGEEE